MYRPNAGNLERQTKRQGISWLRQSIKPYTSRVQSSPRSSSKEKFKNSGQLTKKKQWWKLSREKTYLREQELREKMASFARRFYFVMIQHRVPSREKYKQNWRTKKKAVTFQSIKGICKKALSKIKRKNSSGDKSYFSR